MQRSLHFTSSCLVVLAACLCLSSHTLAEENADDIGKARIAHWKDDKKAAFLLMFDDSIPSHIKVVYPELQKRGFIGTFFVNPGRGEWQPFRDQWEKELPAAGMVYANHTMTHQGVRDFAHAEEEIGQCNEVILRLFPGKSPRLISFGVPGVAAGKWNITKEELATLLAKHHLVARPSFDGHGAMVNVKTPEEMLALVDKALSSGGVEHIVFHGVGGEWITTPVPTFLALLDGLVAKARDLWITDPISLHKYQVERDSAEYRIIEKSDQQLRCVVTTRADPQLYDLPLTVVINAPPRWAKCSMTQGKLHRELAITAGKIQADVMPNGEAITLARRE